MLYCLFPCEEKSSGRRSAHTGGKRCRHSEETAPSSLVFAVLLFLVEAHQEDDEQADEVDQQVGDEDDAVRDAGDDAPLAHELLLLLQLGLLVADLLQDVSDGAHLLHQRRRAGAGELLHDLLEAPSTAAATTTSPALPTLGVAHAAAAGADGRGRGRGSGAGLLRAVVQQADLGEVDVGVGILALGVAPHPSRVPALLLGRGGVLRVRDLAAQAQHARHAVDHELQEDRG